MQGGGAGQSSDIYYGYTGNRRNGFSYDASGNLTNDIGQTFTYDATGQQTASTYTNLQNWYDGDGLRVKRTEDGLASALFLRSSVLGGQVVAEINWFSVAWGWNRGYVYAGSQLLALQNSGVYWMHEDPVTKSKRVTNSAGTVVSTVELDPWGADTNRSNNAAFQPKKFTSYERDSNGADEAMFRRYNRWHSRFDQPDPSDGSYDTTDPQSFNRYAYVQNDPVNFTDPSGLCRPGDEACIETNTDAPRYNGLFDFFLSGGRNGGIRRPRPLPLDPPNRGGGDKGDRPPSNPEGKGNPNCIANAVAGGRVGDTRNISPGAHGGNAHNGIHVEAGPGMHSVTALPAMAGTVLHAGRQDLTGTIGYNFSVVDVLLNTSINGQQYVLGLVDMFYNTGLNRSGQRVVPGRTVGSIEGSANPVGETGLHVSLMPYSAYKQYIDGRFSSAARGSVPVGQLMDAARDPASPFSCP